MGVSRPHRSASLTGDDAPRIAERAATRGRCATECGDEVAGVDEVRYQSNSSFVAAAEPHCPRRLNERFVSAPSRLRRRPPRRSSANAPQRADAAQRTVVLSTQKFPPEARTPTFHA